MWLLRYGDFLLGIGWVLLYIMMKTFLHQGRWFRTWRFLLGAIPLAFVGSWVPQWPAFLGSATLAQHPLWHSVLPYGVVALLWHRFGVAPARDDRQGQCLVAGAHTGFALGFAAYLLLQTAQSGELLWLSSSTARAAWLWGNLIILGFLGWFPPYLGDKTV